MELKKFYEEIGGNYDDALSRLMNDALIQKFILKFNEHNYLEDIEEAIVSGDLEKVFFSVHTLKGVSLNLSFSKLGQTCVELTEYLRGENKEKALMDEVVSLFNSINKEYQIVSKQIKNFVL